MGLIDTVNEIIPEDQKLSGYTIPILISPDDCIRFKVTPKCPWSCAFCHEEGGWDGLQTSRWDEKLEKVFRHLKERGYKEIHFTGGEPTVNPHLPSIIEGLKCLGFMVKTTSILSVGKDTLKKIIGAGLDGVNVSLHADFSEVDVNASYVPPEIAHDIAKMQDGVTIERAIKQILSLVQGLNILIEAGIDIKSNTVVTSTTDIPRMMGIYQYAKKRKIKLRFLGDLNSEAVKSSHEAIRELLKTIGAKPTRVLHKKGTADITVFFEDGEGYEFGVKTIAEVYLERICRDCETKKQGKCTEKYYGIRLERQKAPLTQKITTQVRLCLHRDDAETTLTFEDFLESPQLVEIIAQSL